MTHRFGLIAASGLILASLLSLVQPVQAHDPSTWTAQSLASLTGAVTPTSLKTAHNGEKIALVYATTNTLHFLLKPDATSAWVMKNDDVTGATNVNNQAQVVSIGGTSWVMFVVATVATDYQFWYSSDDGATWTLGGAHDCGGTCSDTFYDLKWLGGTSMGLLIGRQGITDLQFWLVASYLTGDPATTLSDISDNCGSPGCGLTANIVVTGASLLLNAGSNRYKVYFHGNDGQNYVVESSDGLYWTVPYTAEGGSTKAPLATSTNCPGVAATTVYLSAAQSSVDSVFTTMGKNGASNQYLCTYSAYNANTASLVEAYPSAAPATAQTQTAVSPQVASNGFGQYITTARQGTANYVLYKPTTSTAWSQVYTTPANTAESAVGATTSQAYFFYTDFGFGGRLTVAQAEMSAQGRQVAVTNLVGYSMDNAGQVIAVRTANGATIETYGVSDLVQIASASTPDCTDAGIYSDGINSAKYAGSVYVTYADCEDTTSDTDAFRIRDSNLAIPTFPCDQATGNIDNNAQVDVPNALGEIGTISDLTPGYGRVNGDDRCGTQGTNEYATVGFSFSEVGNGKIGVFAVTYNSGGDDIDDKVDATLDSTAFPQIDSFCAWQDPVTGRDYIAGATSNGATGVYEVITSVVNTGAGPGLFAPDLTLTQKFLNNGIYGHAIGLACAQQDLVIQTTTTLYRLNDVMNTTRTQAYAIPVAAAKTRGAAMTGAGHYVEYADGSTIHVVNETGGETGTFPVPTGTWRGMEADNSGENLAVFTSTFITVYDSSNSTCVLDGDCGSLGGTGDDGACVVDCTTSTDSGTCDSFLCTDASTVPEGFTVAAFNGFMGLVLVAMIAVGGSTAIFSGDAKPRGFGLVFGVFAIVGYLIALYFGLLPLWPLIVLAVVAGAVVLLKIRSRTD